MNIVLPFTARDLISAKQWLEWVRELGGIPGCTLHLLAPKALLTADMIRLATFDSPPVIIVDYEEQASNWSDTDKTGRTAEGPNSMFRQAAQHFEYGHLGPWLWCEPDCIPVSVGWASRLWREYAECGKPFMGGRVEVPNVPLHMTGNAIYPQNMSALAPSALTCRLAAWDVVGAAQIVPKCHFTKQIVHHFRHPGFSSREGVEKATAGASMFHSNKDGSLIRFLKQKGGDAECDSVNAKNPTAEMPTGTALIADASNAAPPSDPVVAANVVHTYFSPLENAKGVEEQNRLIDLWKQTWKAHGWEPVVLTEKDAEKHPRYAEWRAAFAKLPTVNPPGYEMACWLRWVAMAQVGGTLTDYDCMNFRFVPGDVAQDGDNIVPIFKGVPCAIVGTQKAYENAINRFISATDRFEVDGKPHVSDMHLIQKWSWRCEDIGREYNSPGWETAKLVHFGHFSCRPRLRSEVAEQFQYVKRSSVEDPKPVPVPKTWIGDLRQQVAVLAGMVDTDSRKNLLRTELRKVNLIGAAKKRK